MSDEGAIKRAVQILTFGEVQLHVDSKRNALGRGNFYRQMICRFDESQGRVIRRNRPDDRGVPRVNVQRESLIYPWACRRGRNKEAIALRCESHLARALTRAKGHDEFNSDRCIWRGKGEELRRACGYLVSSGGGRPGITGHAVRSFKSHRQARNGRGELRDRTFAARARIDGHNHVIAFFIVAARATVGSCQTERGGDRATRREHQARLPS